MKLYYFPGACPLVTHIVLEWIGKPYDTVCLTREQTKEAQYLALNPAGAVPTLVDGDLVLTQSPAILEYLAELNPSAGLLGDTPLERAETRRWLSLCNSDIHKTFSVVFGAEYFSGGDNAMANVLVRQAGAKLQALFALANQQLAGRDWLTGKRSLADPYLFVLMQWAHLKEISLQDFHELARFEKSMQADPGVIAALKAQGLIQ